MDVGYRKDRLTEAEIAKYKQRSQLAINGIDLLLNNLSLFDRCKTAKGRYMLIASYIGLCEDGDSVYNFFMPTESNIVFLLRLSNHNNTNAELYNRHEKNGRPDKRFIFCFMNVQDIIDTPTTFLEAEHHVIQCPNSALFDKQRLTSLLNSLKLLFTKGEFKASNNTENNKEIKENRNMNKKQTIRLNENHIRKIVENVIKEAFSDREHEGSYGLIDILEKMD